MWKGLNCYILSEFSLEDFKIQMTGGKFRVPDQKMLIFYSSDYSAYNFPYKFPL